MSIKKNYGFNLLNSLLSIAFPIITFPYAARILSPEGIGKTQFIFSFAQYFAIIAAFGIPIYGIKAIAKVKDDEKKLSKTTSELLFLSMILVLSMTAIYLILVYSIPSFTSSIQHYLVAGFLILLSVFNVDWFFSGTEQFKIIVIRSTLVKIFGLSLLLLLVKNGGDTLGYLIFLVFIYAGNYLINFFVLIKKVKISFSNLSVKKHLKPLILLLSMVIATTIYTTLDTVVLGFLSNDTEVGYYTAAVKLSKVSIPVLTSMGIVIIPRVSKLIQQKNFTQELTLYTKSFSFLVLLAIPMVMGIFLLSEESILLFSGSKFINAAEDVKILALLPLFIGIGHFLAFQILIPYNKNTGIFYSTVMGMLVFGILCFWLVPKMGSTGTAIANTITELTVTIGYLVLIPKRIRTALPWKKILYAIFGSLLFIPIVLIIKSIFTVTLFIFLYSVLLCIISYFVIQYFLFKEVLIKEIIHSIKVRLYGK